MNNMEDINMEKDAVRLRMKKMRGDVRAPEDTEAGSMILRRILLLPEMQENIPGKTVVALFSPIRMETDLFSQAGILREKGFRVVLPRVSGDTLVFSEAEDAGNLRAGVFGIMEPLPEAATIPLEGLRAVCVPGLAFDRSGGRLGYGKGYYDHFLASSPCGKRPVLIGVGYDFQVLDHIPQEPHDRKMDYIVTPFRTIKTAVFDRN